MKIALDISPLSSGHKVRGVGFYLKHLRDSLEKYFPENIYVLFKDISEVPDDIDLIHYPYFDPFSINQPLTKNYPTVITIHDLIPIKFPEFFPPGLKGKLKWQLNKGILGTMDAIVTDSHSSAQDIVEITGVPENKIRIIHLAAGEQFAAKDVLREGLLMRKYNISREFALYVGDVTWNKNLPRLIEAIKKNNSESKDTSSNIPLVMIGKSLVEDSYDKSNYWNHDRQMVQGMIYKDKNIIPLGYVPDDDLVDIYNLAKIFVFPSLYEGFGLPVLEAMACGTPVITSKAGSLSEVAGEAAYFVDPESVESIKEGISKLWKDTKLQREFSEKGLERDKQFSWKKTAEQTIKVYESVLNRHKT